MQGTCMTTEAWAAPNNAWLRARLWWRRIARLGHSRPRHLRLAETLPLGDRRFVAVIEFDGARFLLGGTASSLVLLARLEDAENGMSSAREGGAAKAAEAGRA
jgi:flagellar biogenesis protein FliO